MAQLPYPSAARGTIVDLSVPIFLCHVGIWANASPLSISGTKGGSSPHCGARESCTLPPALNHSRKRRQGIRVVLATQMFQIEVSYAWM